MKKKLNFKKIKLNAEELDVRNQTQNIVGGGSAPDFCDPTISTDTTYNDPTCSRHCNSNHPQCTPKFQ